MTSTQSNTQAGIVLKTVSTATLVGKEGFLAKLVNGDTAATVELAGAGECALFVITEGAAVGESAELMPLSPERNVRIKAGATIAGGTKVASSSTGKLAAATAGDHVIGVLENDVVDGQLGLVRPALLGFHQAATAYTATVGSALGAFTDPPSAGEMAALRTFVNALRTDMAALETILNAGKITS